MLILSHHSFSVSLAHVFLKGLEEQLFQRLVGKHGAEGCAWEDAAEAEACEARGPQPGLGSSAQEFVAGLLW